MSNCSQTADLNKNSSIPQRQLPKWICTKEDKTKDSKTKTESSRKSVSSASNNLAEKSNYSQKSEATSRRSGSTTQPSNKGASGETTSKTHSKAAEQSTSKPTNDDAVDERKKALTIFASSHLKHAMDYESLMRNRVKGKMEDKMKAAAPYNFFLTAISSSAATHTETLTIQFTDILDKSLGDLESSLQINFMVEYGWLLAQYHITGHRGKPLTILYGDLDYDKSPPSHIKLAKVTPPTAFGSHHTKMAILSYKDGSIRVVVHTANLVESDWDNRTQGVWISPVCPPLPMGHDTGAGESPTGFKKDLLSYLSAYRLPELQEWIGKVQRSDCSNVKVFFIASVPGTHQGPDADKWAQTKLASVLKKNVTIPPRDGKTASDWTIIAQCSSIGSLGPQPTSWFCGEIKNTMSEGQALQLQRPSALKLVYPSFNNVVNSHDGLLGGGGLPYSNKTHAKQPWLNDYLYQWKSDARHRSQAMPHIKTYTRVSPDIKRIAWFHLTSANMSKAAWGTRRKNGGIYIMSYEAGVLFLPKFVTGSTYFPLDESVAENGTPVFPLPYDLPLTPYEKSDVPWFMDNIM